MRCLHGAWHTRCFMHSGLAQRQADGQTGVHGDAATCMHLVLVRRLLCTRIFALFPLKDKAHYPVHFLQWTSNTSVLFECTPKHFCSAAECAQAAANGGARPPPPRPVDGTPTTCPRPTSAAQHVCATSGGLYRSECHLKASNLACLPMWAPSCLVVAAFGDRLGARGQASKVCRSLAACYL